MALADLAGPAQLTLPSTQSQSSADNIWCKSLSQRSQCSLRHTVQSNTTLKGNRHASCAPYYFLPVCKTEYLILSYLLVCKMLCWHCCFFFVTFVARSESSSQYTSNQRYGDLIWDVYLANTNIVSHQLEQFPLPG